MNNMILKLEEDFIYFSEDHKLEGFLPTDFPDPVWLVTNVIIFIESENRLVVRVQTYHKENPGFPGNQAEIEYLEKIESITFKNGLHTPSLLNLKRKTTPKNYFQLNHPKRSFPRQSPSSKPILPAAISQEPEIEEVTVPQIIQKLLNIDWDDIEMVEGGVSFRVDINKVSRTVEIRNEFIKIEFNSIKNYFKRALDIDFVKVQIEAELFQGQLNIIKATSDTIFLINQDLIQKIKLPLINDSLFGKQKKGEPQDFLDAEEFFKEAINQDLALDDFFDDEKEMLDVLIDTFHPKHHRNLKWLSTNHCYQKTSLKYYTKPFSFLFFLEINQKPMVVWETLDTEEATYFWTFKEEKIEDIESILNYCKGEIDYILHNNKKSYISLKKENFKRIIHDYSNLEKGFNRWLSELTK